MVKGGPKLTQIANKSKDLTSSTSLHNNKLIFSFQYFKQEEYFGLSEADNSWFISLIDRLKSMSDIDYNVFAVDPEFRETNHIHPIDWNAKGIIIKKSDFYWVPNIQENELVQFSITKGKGRVIGFLIGNVFYIVALDYKHNIQPAKCNDYKTFTTALLENDLDKAQQKLKECKRIADKCEKECKISNLTNFTSKYILIEMDDNDIETFTKMTSKHTVKEIMEAGLFYLMDE